MPTTCYCGGAIQLLKCPGRSWFYKGISIKIPDNYAIPTCVGCGDEYLDPPQAESLDNILEQVYRKITNENIS
jgi:hypothetical protein